MPLEQNMYMYLQWRAQRSGDARGDCLMVCPLPNSSIEQWPMVIIVTGYKLFVTSQYGIMLTVADQRLGEVC